MAEAATAVTGEGSKLPVIEAVPVVAAAIVAYFVFGIDIGSEAELETVSALVAGAVAGRPEAERWSWA